jgi:hypothetical protein
MADRETLLKDIKAKITEWSIIIGELRAVGEDKLRSSSKDLLLIVTKSILSIMCI